MPAKYHQPKVCGRTRPSMFISHNLKLGRIDEIFATPLLIVGEHENSSANPERTQLCQSPLVILQRTNPMNAGDQGVCHIIGSTHVQANRVVESDFIRKTPRGGWKSGLVRR